MPPVVGAVRVNGHATQAGYPVRRFLVILRRMRELGIGADRNVLLRDALSRNERSWRFPAGI